MFSTLDAQLRAAACTCKPVSASSLSDPSGIAPLKNPKHLQTEIGIECLIVSKRPIVAPVSALLLVKVVRVQSAWRKQKALLLAACKATAVTAARTFSTRRCKLIESM